MTSEQLMAAANWNADKGLALVRQSTYEKNNDNYRQMCDDAGRFLRNHDTLVRKAWLTSRQRKK